MLWTRAEIKERAKTALRGSYWKAFLVTIILLIAGAEGGSGGGSASGANNSRNMDIENNIKNMVVDNVAPYITTILAVSFIIILLAFLFRIFVGYPLEVGSRRYFVRAAKKDIDLGNVGFSFKNKRYMNTIKAMLYKSVLIILWTLLLIIPGIIKSYAYRMVPYILADNPEISHKRAIEMSNAMTNGQKFNIFVLELSFLGWYILGALALGIGVLFVHPYVNATEAELYLVLRQEAIDTGICSPEELNIGEFIK